MANPPTVTPAPDQSAAHLATIWDALFGFRESLIPEGDEAYDRQWAEIAFAMDEIRSALGLPDENECSGTEA